MNNARRNDVTASLPGSILSQPKAAADAISEAVAYVSAA